MGDGMIVEFRDEWLRAFFVNDVRSRNIPPISKVGCSGSSR
jgi:plasmid maintenance system killer protein